MGTLHCALENGADLYVNECQKILTIPLFIFLWHMAELVHASTRELRL